MRRARTATVVKKNISVIPANPEYSRDTRAQYKRLRVAAYCRVSTLQEQQETSYEAQVNYYDKKSTATRNGCLQESMQMTGRALP